jgi:hypothetical protein
VGTAVVLMVEAVELEQVRRRVFALAVENTSDTEVAKVSVLYEPFSGVPAAMVRPLTVMLLES